MFGGRREGALYRYLVPDQMETFCFPIRLRCGCLFFAGQSVGWEGNSPNPTLASLLRISPSHC